MVFYAGNLRMEFTVQETDVKLELSSEDGVNHTHILNVKEYKDFVGSINSFSTEYINNLSEKI